VHTCGIIRPSFTHLETNRANRTPCFVRVSLSSGTQTNATIQNLVLHSIRIMNTTALPKNAPKLSETELGKLRAEFDSFDEDQSGSLDAQEVQKVIERATKKCPSLTEVEYVIQEVDHNNDKVLQFDEFLEMVKHVRVVDNEAYEQFQYFDYNNDGFIEYSELKKGLKSLNQRLKKSCIKRMIEEADVDKNGRVDFEEFKAMLLSSKK